MGRYYNIRQEGTSAWRSDDFVGRRSSTMTEQRDVVGDLIENVIELKELAQQQHHRCKHDGDRESRAQIGLHSGPNGVHTDLHSVCADTATESGTRVRGREIGSDRSPSSSV